MTSRRAIIVAEAAGNPDRARTALLRFGYGPIATVPGVEQALAMLRSEPADLLIVPLQQAGAAEMAILDREIRAHPLLGVIGTAPNADPDLILRAMRAGMHEFLVYPPSAEDLAGAVERLARRTAVAAPVTGGAVGQVMAVYSAKGGLGTTSVAVNVAQACAALTREAGGHTTGPSGQGPRVALADCVFTGGDIRVFLDLKAAYDVEDFVAKLQDMDAALLRSLMTDGPAGVAVLPASEEAVFDDAFDARTTGAIVTQLRSHFDVTIMDCEHHLSERTLAILDAADRILLVTQPNVPALRSAHRTISLFRRLGYTDGKICVVLNRYQSGDAFTVDTVAESIEHEVFACLPNDYRTSAASLNKGICVTQEAAGSKLARGYAELAAKLCVGASREAPQEKSSSRQPRSRLRNLFGKSERRPDVA